MIVTSRATSVAFSKATMSILAEEVEATMVVADTLGVIIIIMVDAIMEEMAEEAVAEGVDVPTVLITGDDLLAPPHIHPTF
jgi:hypothetical protein